MTKDRKSGMHRSTARECVSTKTTMRLAFEAFFAARVGATELPTDSGIRNVPVWRSSRR